MKELKGYQEKEMRKEMTNTTSFWFLGKPTYFCATRDPFTTLGSFIPISAKGYLGQVKARVKGMNGTTNHAMLTLCVEARVSY